MEGKQRNLGEKFQTPIPISEKKHNTKNTTEDFRNKLNEINSQEMRPKGLSPV